MDDVVLNILLIDDDDHDNFFHQRAIAKSGLNCHVKVCTSGLEALDWLQNKRLGEPGESPPERPDIIFLDINMPRFSGWDFLDALAELPSDMLGEPNMIIVMLSTSPSAHTLDRAMSNPLVSEFIEKPLRASKLLTLVEKHLNIA